MVSLLPTDGFGFEGAQRLKDCDVSRAHRIGPRTHGDASRGASCATGAASTEQTRPSARTKAVRMTEALFLE